MHYGKLGNLPDVTSITRHGGSVWWTWIPPTHGTSIEKTKKKLEYTLHSLTGDSTKNSKGGSSQGEPSGKVPTLKAWEGSILKMVGLDAFPTYNTMVAWFPAPVEFTERYFQQLHRLNWEMDTSH